MAVQPNPKQSGAATAAATNNESPSVFRLAVQSKEFGVFIALIILCVFMSLASPYFATSKNIFNVLQGMSTIAIVAIGETMVLVAGGLDLSVGAVLAVGAMVTARTMTYYGFHPWIAFGAGLLSGLIFGTITGLIITKGKINPFITTLGMLSIGRGLAYLLATGLEGTVV